MYKEGYVSSGLEDAHVQRGCTDWLSTSINQSICLFDLLRFLAPDAMEKGTYTLV